MTAEAREAARPSFIYCTLCLPPTAVDLAPSSRKHTHTHTLTEAPGVPYMLLSVLLPPVALHFLVINPFTSCVAQPDLTLGDERAQML